MKNLKFKQLRATFTTMASAYVAEKFREEMETDWGSAVIYRWPALVLASLAATFGASATQLTLFSLSLLPLMLAAVALPVGYAMPTSMALAIIFNILDCADGPVARATSTQSQSGAYLDFATDLLYRFVMLASIGLYSAVVAERFAVLSLFLTLGAGFSATYARLARLRAKGYLLKSKNASPRPKNFSIFQLGYSFLSGIDTLTPILALIMWHFGWLLYFIVAIAALHIIDAAIAVAENYFKIRNLAPPSNSE